jgi:hypothetical protein
MIGGKDSFLKSSIGEFWQTCALSSGNKLYHSCRYFWQPFIDTQGRSFYTPTKSNILSIQIGDPAIADAILDRLIHNAHKINLKGGSLRKKICRLDLKDLL